MSCPACEPARLRRVRFCPDCGQPVAAAAAQVTEIMVSQNVGEVRGGHVTGVAVEQLHGTVTAQAYQLAIGAVHGGVVNVALAADGLLVEPRPSPIQLLPRPFPGLLDRQTEVDAAVEALQSAVPLVLYGEPGLGKTSLLRSFAYHPCVSNFPDGVLCLPAYGRTRADLLQLLFDAFYACSIPYKPGEAQIQHALQGKRALVVLDDLDLPRPDLEALMNLAPGCTFLLASTDRCLWGEGKAIALPGLPQDAALALVERELGRSLDHAERRAFPELWRVLDGHPQRLLEAAANAREERRSLAALLPMVQAPGLLEAHVLGALTAPQQQVLAALAAPGGASLSAGQLAALAQQPAVEQALEALERRRLVESDGQRYSMSGALAATVWRTWDRSEPMQRALAYFQDWLAQGPAQQQLLAESDVLLQLLDWAARSRRWSQVLDLARGLEGALALDLRWDAWRQTLSWALEAGRALNDQSSTAWALHQLGTRALCLEQFNEARSNLSEALALRERLGDQQGAQVTRHNLELLGRLVPGQRDGKRARRRMPLRTMLLLLSGLLTLSLAGLAGALWLGFPGPSSSGARLILPANMQVEASTRAGAPVSFSVAASGANGQPLPVPGCDRRSGDIFPLGTTLVTCSLQTADGQTAQASFSVTVQDTTRPVLSLPESPLVQITTSLQSRNVTYSVSASDVVDGELPVSCEPAPGTSFGVGETWVSCSTEDHSGNRAEGRFQVRIVKRTESNMPPSLQLQETVVAEASDSHGAVVDFYVSATDREDRRSLVPTCKPSSGQRFPIGRTSVRCLVTDSGGLDDTGVFTVVVSDGTGPTLDLPPSPLFWPTDSSEGDTVTYEMTAYDAVDGAVPVECVPPPGSFLPVGRTRVTCSASDSRGNQSPGEFVIVVEYVPRLPDLVVVSINSPELLSVGGVTHVNVVCSLIYTVANQGPLDAPGSLASIEYRTATASERESLDTPALKAGESRQLEANLPARACDRPVFLQLSLDIRQAIEEADETNNSVSRDFEE